MTILHTFELAAPVLATDHSLGPSDAAVTLVEYGDFECPNCKQAAPVVKLLLSHFIGRLRVVYRHFPLEEVHPHALSAAKAAECAGGQGKFWPMHDVLFENQGALKFHHWSEYAQRLELDMASLHVRNERYGLSATNSGAPTKRGEERSALHADILHQWQAARRFFRHLEPIRCR